MSGLYVMGRHRTNPREYWGISYRYQPEYRGRGEIAFMGCPSMYQTTSLLIKEPHGSQSVEFYGDCGYGNGQADWRFVGSNPDRYHYDRNYLYGDGHVAYVHAERRGEITY
jgi:prepilin-type processing-associated H-X9-DG protein